MSERLGSYDLWFIKEVEEHGGWLPGWMTQREFATAQRLTKKGFLEISTQNYQACFVVTDAGRAALGEGGDE